MRILSGDLGGLVGNAYNTTLTNCYYTGTINVQDTSYLVGVGAIVGRWGSSKNIAINCHWLKSDNSLAVKAVGISFVTTVIDSTAYDDVFQMYELAGTLNGCNGDSVWIKIPDGTPQLKFYFEGGDV